MPVLQFKNADIQIDLGSANMTVIGKSELYDYDTDDVSVQALKCEDEYTLIITIDKFRIILFSKTKKTNCVVSFGEMGNINFDLHFNGYFQNQKN